MKIQTKTKLAAIVFNTVWSITWAGLYYYGAIHGRQWMVDVLKAQVIITFLLCLFLWDTDIFNNVSEGLKDSLEGNPISLKFEYIFYFISSLTYLFQGWIIIALLNVLTGIWCHSVITRVKTKNI